MNTTASFSSEPSWSRRCSTETIFSIQGKETDFVRDTSDTDWFDSDGEAGVEYEPASEPDDDGPLSGGSSGHSDNEIIATKVIEISVGDDGELQLADSELTASSSDSEMDLHDYWLCAHCRAQNNNPMYRYCEKCFKERKNFFPPRPKRKRKRELSTQHAIEPEPLPRTLSQDSGVESVANSQELSQRDLGHSSQSSVTESVAPKSFQTSTPGNTLIKKHLKRRAESADRHAKRFKIDYSDSESDTGSDSSRNSKCNVNVNDNSNIKTEILVARNLVESKTVSDSETNTDRNILMLSNNIETRSVATMVSDSEFNNDRSKSIFNSDLQVKPLVKMVSDPALTIENTDVKLTNKVIVNTIKEKLDIESKDLCIVCSVEPKSGVFVHGRIAHICCCYECAVKVWFKAKRCPVCNMKVSNVLKAVVM